MNEQDTMKTTLETDGKKITINASKREVKKLTQIISLSSQKLDIPVTQYDASKYTSWNTFERVLGNDFEIAYIEPLFSLKKLEHKNVSEKIGYLIITKDDIFNFAGDDKKRITQVIWKRVEDVVKSELIQYNILLKNMSLHIVEPVIVKTKKKVLAEV